MTFISCIAVLALIGSVAVNGDSGSAEIGSAEERGRCYCNYRSCTGVAATNQVIGCPNTNAFRTCNAGLCAVQACPALQVWNYLKNACSACDAGKHISADLQVCVCNQGTTLNPRTNTCVNCPSGATTEIDRCYCPSNLARDYTNNACKVCPADAPITYGGKCMCTSPTLFFNPLTWTCVPCSGTLIPPRRGYGRSSCRCAGANQIFNERNASCYTCPAGTSASRDGEECQCPRYSGQEFDITTGMCACRFGYTLNVSGVCALNIVPLSPQVKMP